MANQLKMEQQEAIKALAQRGWSERRIAREFGVHRKTVRHYARQLEPGKGTISRTGSEEDHSAKGTIARTGITGRQSKCEPYAPAIEAKMEAGLSAQRIYQDLRLESDFDGSYDAVQRFVKKLKARFPERVWRMEVEPGEEAQIDYGTMRLLDEGVGGRLKKVHLLCVTLSHSRKSYCEAARRQSTESFIRSLENAFRHFGGVPANLCIDNLRAAVTKADWYEPDIHPKIRDFARHYGTTILPTRSYTPEHKGKVESGVKYVKNNALKGKTFTSLAGIDAHLRWWETHIADTRIHGTTKKQVSAYFTAVEKPALLALPADLFPCFEEGPRSVHRDGYVEIKGAYYHLPEEYIGRTVWARWEQRIVHLFSHRMEPIISHRRLEPGKFTQVLAREGARGSVEQSSRYYRSRTARLGPHCARWADSVIAAEPAMAIRRMQGLLALRKKHTAARLDRACKSALDHGHHTLKQVKAHLTTPGRQPAFGFLDQHELIRDMDTYGQIAGAFSPSPNHNQQQTQK